MTFTAEELPLLAPLTPEQITEAIDRFVAWSFERRPMLVRTDREARRRVQICEFAWRYLFHDLGLNAVLATHRLPLILIEEIDSVIADTVKVSAGGGEFVTKLFPAVREQLQMVEGERTLSALAQVK